MRTTFLLTASLLVSAGAFAQAKAPEPPAATKAPAKPAAPKTAGPSKPAAPAAAAPPAAAADPDAAEAGDGAAGDAGETEAPPNAPAPAPQTQPAPSMGPAVQMGFGAPTYPTAAPQADQPVQSEPPGPPREKSRYPGWQAFVGLRGAFVPNAGYDPFDDSDFMGQGSIGFGRTVYTAGQISIAGMLYYDGSNQTGDARGEATRLALHRVTLSPEARFHLLPELYLYARAGAGPLRAAARLEESSTGTTLYANDWLLAIDGFAGIAYELLDASGQKGELRIWVAAEGGYGWTTDLDLKFAAEEDDGGAPQRSADVDLGTFAARGGGFRGMIGVSF